MNPSKNCINLIKKWESFSKDAYLCPANKVTIGYGSCMWSDGKLVKLGEKIDLVNAEKLLMWELNNKKIGLANLKLSQNQFDALLSFIYNVGLGNWNKSTLLKKCKVDPDDPAIHDEFLKWNKARKNGVLTVMKGLTNRRMDESALYFKI